MTARLRYAQSSDLADIVNLHVSAFPTTFTTLLGPSFLRGYYSKVIKADHGVAIVAEVGSDIAGFAVGSATPAALYADLYRSRCRLAAQILLPAMRNPLLLPRLAQAFARTRQRRVSASRGCAELCSLAVAVDHRRSRIGEALVTAFCTEVSGREVQSVLVRTPLKQNDAVLAFYTRLNFRETAREPHGRDRMMVNLTYTRSTVPVPNPLGGVSTRSEEPM